MTTMSQEISKTAQLPSFWRSQFVSFATVLRQMPLSLWLALVVIVTVMLWAALPFLFTNADPLSGIGGQQLLAPSWEHWMGTDALGRDLYSRVIYGASRSLLAAFVAVSLGLMAGVALGVFAGSFSGWIDDVIMRWVDVLLSVPHLLLSLSIIIVLGFGTVNVAIAVGIASVASFARLTRAEVVRVRRSDFVEAAFVSGARFWSVLWRHILPNSLTSVFAFAALQFGSAILSISTLSVLGYGAPPPTPEWGLLIAEGRNYLMTAWWLTTIPGLVAVAVVLAANRISAAAQEKTV